MKKRVKGKCALQKKTLPVSIFLISIICTIVITAVVTHFIDQKQAMDNVEAHLCDIFDFLKNFDIKPEDSITTSYLEMVQKI